MKTMLVTGGTVFVSRYMAEYFVRRGWQVTVLNRNTRPQSDGVTLIEADRHELGDKLRGMHFDAVLDVTAYTAQDVNDLLDALGSCDDYVMISSSAEQPENTWSSMIFRPLGRVTCSRLVQPWKMPQGRVVMPLGSFTFFNAEQ